jgi:two-component system sensor histidine kinase/response regulator
MPEMDGYEASEIIIQTSMNNSVNIIALTAENDLEEKRKSKNIGMKESISKPINPEELENLIQKYYFNK